MKGAKNRPKKKNQKDESVLTSSFSINYKYESDPQYPYLLALNLSKSEQQFEITRTMKMLGEWIEDYAKLSQILKYRYAAYLPKIQKVLLNKYQAKVPIQYCLSRFLVHFFGSWKEFTSALVQNMQKSDKYTMEFLWYTCHTLVQDMSLNNHTAFLDYLTSQFEESLRHYIPEQAVQARKVIEIVYLMNIQGCQEPFKKNAVNWSKKFISFQEATNGDSQLIMMLDIVKNKNVLQMKEQAFEYWRVQVMIILQSLEQNVDRMSIDNPMDKQILDIFMWLLDLKQVREIIVADQARFIKTLLMRMQPRQRKSGYIFEHQKYSQILGMLYILFFEENPEATKARLGEMMQKFIGHSYFVLNEQKNYNFLVCLTKHSIGLSQSVITDIIRVLSNNHIRRTLPAKVLMVLAQTIYSSLDSYQLPIDVVGHCLKAFSQSMFHKTNDPLISQLRSTIGMLFLGIMRRYAWQDGYKNDAIFNFCEQSQRNSDYVSSIIFEMLYLLIKKFGFNNQTKLEPLLNDILNKTIANQEQLNQIISLLITAVEYLKYNKAVALIQEVCQKNPSQHAPFFLFQALALAQPSFPSQADAQVIGKMICSGVWQPRVVDINLMMLQVFFMKIGPEQALKMFRRFDKEMACMFKELYDVGNYRLLSLIAGRSLPAIGGDPDLLESLEVYRWMRQFSFDMLARSFYKSTSINVCYVFSNILLRSENPGLTLRWLAKDQFIDYLYQGLNDFLSKEKQFTLEIATTVLFFSIIKKESGLIPAGSRLNDFLTLVKNVTWWEEAGTEIQFVPYDQNAAQISEVLPEFKTYYEAIISAYFKDYFKLQAEKVKKAEELEHNNREEEI